MCVYTVQVRLQNRALGQLVTMIAYSIVTIASTTSIQYVKQHGDRGGDDVDVYVDVDEDDDGVVEDGDFFFGVA